MTRGLPNTDTCHRTIHGMVYNAMKLFMEINPQLFDDCSHEYTEQQNSASAREAMRERKWAVITEQASRRRSGSLNGVHHNDAAASTNGSSAPRTQVTPMPRLDEAVDPSAAAEDNSKRLDSLKLQDGERRDHQQQGQQSAAGRPRTHERQNSAASNRSQQRGG
jgi:serine/threonine-protein phosphatase 2A regulatory subunit B'